MQAPPVVAEKRTPARVEPDLDFIRALGAQAGASYKKCMQCGTCSGTCELSPDASPFPRKEMAWAAWGLKDRLLGDPDVWLCHQCNDCSTNCPRGSRPGDVMAAIRQEAVIRYAAPSFLARWVSQPKYIPLLLAIPAVLLAIAIRIRLPIEEAMGITRNTGDRIVFSYTSRLPHTLINTFFGLFVLLALIGAVAGLLRFWRALKAADTRGGAAKPVKGVGASVFAVLKSVLSHRHFTSCTASGSRFFSHLLLFFGFLGLGLVAIWVVFARINPLVPDGFVYPFDFWSPWKMLANAGGAAVIIGCLWMGIARFRDPDRVSVGSYADWSLLVTIVLVTGSGLATYAVHYIRLEPHRHAVYFIHLILVFALLVYLPYSKLAHLIYRTAAMVYAEHTGREWGASPSAVAAKPEVPSEPPPPPDAPEETPSAEPEAEDKSEEEQDESQ